MYQFPYNSPIILTDQVFLQYGGQTGTSTNAQRQASYLLAEEQVTEDLSSFLHPTVITGTIFWHQNFAETEFGHIQRILLASATKINSLDPLETETVTGSALIRNADYGYIDLVFPNYWSPKLYTVSIVYESGLSTGTSSQPTMLQALTIAAQINLNEMDSSLSNESTADIGVQKFSNQSYTEERAKLKRTTFGTSALAQRAARLIRKYRSKPAFGLR